MAVSIVKTKDHELLTFRDELNQLKVTADISGVIKLSLNLLLIEVTM